MYSVLKDFSLDMGVRFLGSLKGVDLSTYDEETIKILINGGFFLEGKFQIMAREENSTEFSTVLDYEGVRYEINPLIIGEVFCLLQNYAEGNGASAEYELEKIFFKVNKLIGKKDKIKYLKKCYKKQFPKDTDYEMYSDLENNGRIVCGAYKVWFEYVHDDYLSSDSGLFLLKKYLTFNKSADRHWFSKLMILTVEHGDFMCDVDFGELIGKWYNFHEKQLLLSGIIWKIGEIEDANKVVKGRIIEGKENEGFDVGSKANVFQDDYSASEIAYYVYYKDYVKESVIEDNGLKREEYWKKIGETFGRNGANIRKEYGKLVKDKEYRLQPTSNRVSMLEKILPLLSEKSKIHCKDELEIIKLNL